MYSYQIRLTYRLQSGEVAVKGNTATSATKNATVETGLNVRVPLFINEGEVIEISTADGKYSGRA